MLLGCIINKFLLTTFVSCANGNFHENDRTKRDILDIFGWTNKEDVHQSVAHDLEQDVVLHSLNKDDTMSELESHRTFCPFKYLFLGMLLQSKLSDIRGRDESALRKFFRKKIPPKMGIVSDNTTEVSILLGEEFPVIGEELQKVLASTTLIAKEGLSKVASAVPKGLKVISFPVDNTTEHVSIDSTSDSTDSLDMGLEPNTCCSNSSTSVDARNKDESSGIRRFFKVGYCGLKTTSLPSMFNISTTEKVLYLPEDIPVDDAFYDIPNTTYVINYGRAINSVRGMFSHWMNFSRSQTHKETPSNVGPKLPNTTFRIVKENSIMDELSVPLKVPQIVNSPLGNISSLILLNISSLQKTSVADSDFTSGLANQGVNVEEISTNPTKYGFLTGEESTLSSLGKNVNSCSIPSEMYPVTEEGTHTEIVNDSKIHFGKDISYETNTSSEAMLFGEPLSDITMYSSTYKASDVFTGAIVYETPTYRTQNHQWSYKNNPLNGLNIIDVTSNNNSRLPLNKPKTLQINEEQGMEHELHRNVTSVEDNDKESKSLKQKMPSHLWNPKEMTTEPAMPILLNESNMLSQVPKPSHSNIIRNMLEYIGFFDKSTIQIENKYPMISCTTTDTEYTQMATMNIELPSIGKTSMVYVTENPTELHPTKLTRPVFPISYEEGIGRSFNGKNLLNRPKEESVTSKLFAKRRNLFKHYSTSLRSNESSIYPPFKIVEGNEVHNIRPTESRTNSSSRKNIGCEIVQLSSDHFSNVRNYLSEMGETATKRNQTSPAKEKQERNTEEPAYATSEIEHRFLLTNMKDNCSSRFTNSILLTETDVSTVPSIHNEEGIDASALERNFIKTTSINEPLKNLTITSQLEQHVPLSNYTRWKRHVNREPFVDFNLRYCLYPTDKDSYRNALARSMSAIIDIQRQQVPFRPMRNKIYKWKRRKRRNLLLNKQEVSIYNATSKYKVS